MNSSIKNKKSEQYFSATPEHITQIFHLLEQDHNPTMLEQLSQYNHFQRLIATLLSSRTKDSTTIPIVKRLFLKYKTPADFLKIKAEELYGIGFYRVKAKNIHRLSKIIINEQGGQVPCAFEELTALPGVGRKTANCVLAYVFQQPAIGVDVHVHRITNRLGWVKTKTPEETEIALQGIVPQKDWHKINMLLVDYGQRVCLPRTPKCSICPINQRCDYGKNVLSLNSK